MAKNISSVLYYEYMYLSFLSFLDLNLRLNGSLKSKNKPKKAKGVTFDKTQDRPRPGFAFLILRYILSHALNRAILIKKNFTQLQELLKMLIVSNLYIF